MMHDSSYFIDIDQLKARSGSATFYKGMTLFQQGKVSSVKVLPDRVYSKVQGTKKYDVELADDEEIECYCDCPAAEYQEVCKHAIATALYVLANLDDLDDGANQEDDRSSIRRYLLEHHSKETLVELLLGYIEKKESECNKWLMKAKFANEGPSLSSLFMSVDCALPRESLWGWEDVREYFNDADEQFEAIWEAMDSLAEDAQWQLLNYIIERLNLVLEEIDDSGGHRFGIEGQINLKMPEVFAQLAWSEEEKANWLFKHMKSHPFDVFPNISSEFADQCQANRYFLALCQQALDELDDEEDKPWHIRQCADFLIANSNDWRDIARIKKKIAHRLSDHLALCQFYLDNHEELEAEHWLAKTRKQFNRHGDELTCDRMEVNIRAQLGEHKQAWRLANQIFEQQPRFNEYQWLEELQAELGIEDESFLHRVEEVLKAYGESNTALHWSHPADELLEFYLKVNAFDKACLWVEKHKVERQLLLTLADKIVQQRPNDALSYYLRVVAVTIEETNNSAYHDAMDKLRKVEKLLATSPDVLAAFYVQVAQLATTYKQKRNMLALFKQYYGKYI
ncbi:MAG: SWIM zinc finger family protein [Shewanella sp.]|nr:SWIM zinc finger family protein [Shewanella sp.]